MKKMNQTNLKIRIHNKIKEFTFNQQNSKQFTGYKNSWNPYSN